MGTSLQETTALLAEHFRYTPLTLLDDIINTVNELTFRAINAIEEGLLSADPAVLGFGRSLAPLDENDGKDASLSEDTIHERMRLEIEEGVVKLESLLNSTVDHDFDILELYVLRSLLNVPEEDLPWITLPHYKDLSIPKTKGPEESPTPESIQLLRRKVQETEKLNAALHAESARNEAMLAQLRSLTGKNLATPSNTEAVTPTPAPLAFLTAPNPAKPLAQNTQFVLTQLPLLRDLLARLRPRIASLPNVDAARSEASAKRKAYIDGQSKRIMERRGIHVDDAISGAEGMPGTFVGRRVGSEELRAIEGIAASMSGDKMEEG
ncbi:hypothetical protein LTR66_007400 [Elasticomyces elasticus]|nr:hypothetical protein LTR28_011492 [Elasticomyces elasticus]KAK4988148.1 hypothetical protein LTR66_007400 [Elasticomyces elasticus]